MKLMLLALCVLAGCNVPGVFEDSSGGTPGTEESPRPSGPPALKPGEYRLQAALPQLVSTIPAAVVHAPQPDDVYAGEPRASDKRCRLTALPGKRFELQLDGFQSVAHEQQDSQWCWAACVQMVNQYAHVTLVGDPAAPGLRAPTQQELLVSHFTIKGMDEGGSLSVMIRALNPDLESGLAAAGMTASLSFECPTTDDIVDSLLEGRPAIVGLELDGQHHALVVCGATISVRKQASGLVGQVVAAAAQLPLLDSARYAIHALALSDPADAGRVRPMTGEELGWRCKLILTPSLARRTLVAALEQGRKRDGKRDQPGLPVTPVGSWNLDPKDLVKRGHGH